MSNFDDLEIPDQAQSCEDNDVWFCVLELDPEFRNVVIMYYYEGFQVKEISQILKIPAGTVKSRLKRARDKLEVMLFK